MEFRSPFAHQSEVQLELARLNRGRLMPVEAGIESLFKRRSETDWTELKGGWIEAEFLAEEHAAVRERAKEVPREPGRFIEWFEDLKRTGPGQDDPLFPWLAEEASLEGMKWFISQEVAGEAGFDDLVALTQVRMPVPVKLELARNYWDEMGRGTERGMHGPMLAKLAQELGVSRIPIERIVPEALALGNLMASLALHRETAFHSLGCLGVVELTAPDRARAVYRGLKRLGVTPVGQRYYLLHSTLDLQHSERWNREALLPLLRERPECAPAVAEGALMRLAAGARCFVRYRQDLLFWNGFGTARDCGMPLEPIERTAKRRPARRPAGPRAPAAAAARASRRTRDSASARSG